MKGASHLAPQKGASQLQGIVTGGKIKCPYCNQDIDLMVNIPDAHIMVFTKIPDSKERPHKTFLG